MQSHSNMRRSILLAGVGGVLMATSKVGFTQASFPSRPIRLIVPFPPGGTTDTLARLLSAKLSTLLGQTVIVENRPGANTQIGTMELVRSQADGHTLLIAGPSTFTANPAVKTSIPYDPVKDFDYIGLAGTMPVILLATANTKFKDIATLVQQAQARPSEIFYGSFGPGSIMHFAGETLNSVANIKLESVAYKGSTPAITDLMGEQIPLTFDTVVVAAPYIKAGRVQALGVTTAQRSTLLPDVPTMAEAGYRMDISSWLGIVAPAGLPDDVRQKLEKAVTEAVSATDMKQSMLSLGIESAPTGGDAFKEKVRNEYAAFRQLAIDNNITSE